MNRYSQNTAWPIKSWKPGAIVPAGQYSDMQVPPDPPEESEASTDDGRFREEYQHWRDLIHNRPEEYQPGPLKGPSTAQLVAGGLGALLMPRLAAAAIAAPFQAAFATHAQNEEDARAKAEESQRRWGNELSASQEMLNTLRPETPSNRGVRGASVPAPAGPVGVAGGSAAPTESSEGDPEAVRSAAADGVLAVKGARIRLMPPAVSASINESTYLANLARQGVARAQAAYSSSPGANTLKDLGSQYENAQVRMTSVLSGVAAQRSAFTNRMREIDRLMVAAAPEARGQLQSERAELDQNLASLKAIEADAKGYRDRARLGAAAVRAFVKGQAPARPGPRPYGSKIGR